MFHLIPRVSIRLWIHSFILGIVIAILCIGYNAIRTGIDPYLINSSIAFAALFLILISHALSGFSYFWGTGKSKLGYRKSLGVVGFALGLVHGTNSLILYSRFFESFDFFYNNIPAILAAYSAIALFIFMVVISNFGMPAKLGALRWRKMLRVSGYMGIILIMIHMSIFSLPAWRYWLTNFSPVLPPLSMLLFTLSTTTLTLRVMLWVALSRKKVINPTATSLPTQPLSQSVVTPLQ